MGDRQKKRLINKEMYPMHKYRQPSVPTTGNCKKLKVSSNFNRKRRCCSDSPGRRINVDISLLANNANRAQFSTDFLRARVNEIYSSVKMPEDFFKMWTFCAMLKPDNPRGALLSIAGIELCGPYDCVSDYIDNIHMHCRYYYDQPEFMTVLRTESVHFGYVRDKLKQLPWCVAMNNESRSYEFKKVGENLFVALKSFLLVVQTNCSRRSRDQINQLINRMMQFAKQQGGIHLTTASRKIMEHEQNAYAVPISGLGMAQFAYPRPSIDKGELSDMLRKAIVEKDENSVFAYERLLVQCNQQPALALYVGLSLFSFGVPSLHSLVERMAVEAYAALDNSDFGNILSMHLCDRRKVNGADRRALKCRHSKRQCFQQAK